jgi:hypothetical protein
MIHYEVFQLRTLPDHVNGLGQDYSAFGWERINREEYKKLLANPDQPDPVPVTPSKETIKSNQTVYPDSPNFSDWGNSNVLSVPSANDSGTYDGLQNVYFKRNTALPYLDQIAELKTRYDAIKKEINDQEDALKRRKEVGHLLFSLAILPILVGFFALMGALVCTVLSLAEPEDYPNLQTPAVALWAAGGTLWLIGFVLVGFSVAKGISKPQEKICQAAIRDKIKEKEEILSKARSLHVQGPLPPIEVHLIH